MHNSPLKQESSTKYLAVLIDEHQNRKSHVSHIESKIKRGVGVLSKLRHTVTNIWGLTRGAQMLLVTNFVGFLSHLFLVQNIPVAFSSEQNVAVIVSIFKQLFALLISLELAQL